MSNQKIIIMKTENKFKNRSALYVTSALFIIILAQACKTSDYVESTHPSSDLFGTWVTKVDEPVDGKCTIEVDWKSDFTTAVLFKYKNGTVYKTSSTWEYQDPNYNEVFPEGDTGAALIKWVNKNKFKLIIVENQDTENYKGRVRVYKRK